MNQKKQYTPEFKAKVVLESYQRDTTIEAVRKKFGVSKSMIHRWRQEVETNLPLLFTDKRNPKAKGQAQGYHPGESPDNLKKPIAKRPLHNRMLKNTHRQSD